MKFVLEDEIAIANRGKDLHIFFDKQDRMDRFLFINHAEFGYPIALQTLLAIKELCESEGGEFAGKVLSLMPDGSDND